MKKKNRLLLSVVIIVLLLITAAGILYWYPYQEGYERQEIEEELALQYLQVLQESILSQENTANHGYSTFLSEKTEEVLEDQDNSDKKQDLQAEGSDWSDDVYYEKDGITYTPDYAAGVLDCVLIIPRIQLCRGVYTGTWNDILHNLDVWMVTAARPDYMLGETHYCIYGHNTPRLNLSFNRLQSLNKGDIFYLVNPDGAYQYQVTDIMGVSRSDSTCYTDDFTLGSEKCYIITCGRNEYRYLDLIVEGTLESFTETDQIDIDGLF